MYRYRKNNFRGHHLNLSSKRKKRKGEALKKWREEEKKAAQLLQQQMDALRETTPAEYLCAVQAAGGLDGLAILPDIPGSSSMGETSLDISHQEASSTSPHASDSEPSSAAYIKQEPQDSYSIEQHSSSSNQHSSSPTPFAIPDSNLRNESDLSCKQSSSSSITHLPSSQLPSGLQIKAELDQDSCLSSENSLPSIDHSFSLTPNGTPDSTVSSMSTDERSSFEMRINLLGKHWIEKMKVLRTDQRIFAEKLINDVLFEAELCRLKHGCHVEISN